MSFLNALTAWPPPHPPHPSDPRPLHPPPDHRVQLHWVSEGFPWLTSWDSRNCRDPCRTHVSGSTWALKYNIYYAAVQPSSHERADKTYCGEKLWSRGFDKTKTHQRFVITSQHTHSKVVLYLTSDTEVNIKKNETQVQFISIQSKWHYVTFTTMKYSHDGPWNISTSSRTVRMHPIIKMTAVMESACLHGRAAAAGYIHYALKAHTHWAMQTLNYEGPTTEKRIMKIIKFNQAPTGDILFWSHTGIILNKCCY